jgi:UDP-N-acetyl-D-glucosamine dehydrogenase
MNHFEALKEKIDKRTAVVSVVGLGYVGLPLAVEKARAGYKVIGFDVQQKRVDMVNKAVNYIGDVVDDDLAKFVNSGMMQATTDYSLIEQTDCVAICVPTPLDKYQQPDVSYVQSSSREVAKHAHPGMLVVLESTTYPGTTEEIVMPLFTERGFKIGEDIFLAFSPERVDPGNKQYNTRNTPKVVGGVTKQCTDLAAMLYGNVLEGDLFKASGPKVAEMEKILENTFRNINIALANEMAILCHRMGIDVWEVIDAARTKPYGFMAFYPGPGLGGHCIPIDPFYLTWKAREYNYHTRLIETAGEINNYMPEFVVERVSRLLNEVSKPLKGSRIMLLGAAYKRDIDDLRESPVLKILELLQQAHSNVTLNDPFIPQFTHAGVQYKSQPLDSMAEADIVIITTDHTAYKPEDIAAKAKLVFDTRNVMKGVTAPHVHRL